jgi:hydrogenase-4 component B
VSPGPLLALAAGATSLAIVLGRWWRRAWLGTMLVGAGAGAAAAISGLAGGPEWEFRSGFVLGGESLHLRLDALSALFLLLLAAVGGAGALYAHEYWADAAHPRSARSGRSWWSALVLCIGIVLITSNGLHFLIGWELFAVCAYYLIALERSRAEVRAAGWLYLAASHAGTLVLFAFFGLLAAETGGWELGPMLDRTRLAPLYWLALVGFGLKAGVFPLHIWLPTAHANAPSHVSAILSGVTIKVSIYGLLRFSAWMPLPAGASVVVVILGVASAVLGVAFALGQHDLKRLLAYHSVENVGIILIGLGFAMFGIEHGDATWGLLALAGGLLHVWNHGLFKALLFLGAGSVLHATGTREMSRLGGLWRNMPWTTGLFALGAAAISGLPPLNGFVSEWLVYLGLFDATVAHGPSGWIAVPTAVFLAATGALALACFAKVCGVALLGAPRTDEAAHARECGWPMRSAMLLLASACVMIGVAPLLVWPAILRATGAWRSTWAGASAPAPLGSLGLVHVGLVVTGLGAAVWLRRRVARRGLVRRGTWDCGYAAPTARMQYTAGSFASTITEWFAFILRPERDEVLPAGPFPRDARSSRHTPETVLERVVEPVGHVVLRISRAARRLQHGRVQSYVLYVVVCLAALATWIAAGSGP